MMLQQVDESHEGVYSCTPYNTLGSEGASAGVRVRVQKAPALLVRPQPLYVVRLGATLTLPCAAALAANAPLTTPVLRWTRVYFATYMLFVMLRTPHAYSVNPTKVK